MAQKINQKQYGKKYSTTEQLTGDVWIDGKPIYRKTINTGAMPNNTSKNVAHGITGISAIVRIYGYAYGASVGWTPLPYMESGSNVGYSARLVVSSTNISFRTYSDSSGLTSSYTTLEYTKT